MYRSKRISLVLPCRNEAKNLKVVLENIPEIVDEVIVVCNKSTDRSASISRRFGAKVYKDNRTAAGIGYGFAHITGTAKATGGIIVGADCDGTYPVEAIPKIVNHLLDNELDFISCSRYPLQKGVKIPYKLQIGVKLLNMEVRIFYGKKFNDILSGMWVFKKEIADELKLTMGDWNLSPQIKLNAAMNPEIAFTEYGIVQRQRIHNLSHQNYFKTGLGHAWWILQNRFRSPAVQAEQTDLQTAE